MNLLMISGDRSLARDMHGAFFSMLTEFSKHFGRIDIVCPHASGIRSPDENGMEVLPNVFVHPSPYGLLRQPFWILSRGSALIKKHRHEMMTVQEYPPFYNGIGAILLKRRTGIAGCLEVHHVIGWPKAASVSELIGRWLSKLLLGIDAMQFESVRTVNETAKQLLVSFGVPAARVHTVPSAYLDHDLLGQDPVVIKRYDVCFCARLSPNKGLLAVIEAMVLLPQKTLLVIGEGPVKAAAIAAAKRLGISDRITFAGWMKTPADVTHAMRSGRVFVMNSLSEGGPRTALEAMACGLPVVSTMVGVMPDVIQDGKNGLFTTGKPKDLADKIGCLLADSELSASIGVAAKDVLGLFERTSAIRAYADFLKRTV